MTNEFFHFSNMEDLLGRRHLQQSYNYTSPPTAEALEATPEEYRNDDFIKKARNMSAFGLCSPQSAFTRCHIPFPPVEGAFDVASKVGIILYKAAFVDARSYSPLAALLRDRYGFPVVIPIFSGDIALKFGTCNTDRMALAQAEFQDIQKWIFMGHALGGVAATTDVWTIKFTNSLQTNMKADAVGGLVLMGADVQSVGCGIVDFLGTGFPMAVVTASEDTILNRTRFELNRPFASNATFFMSIYGGNQRQFGAYDDSGRLQALGQQDGIAVIPEQVQWDLTAGAVYNVAARTGALLAKRAASGGEIAVTMAPSENQRCPPGSEQSGLSPDNSAASSMKTIDSGLCFLLFILVFWLKSKI